jgi:hypothetical protein
MVPKFDRIKHLITVIIIGLPGTGTIRVMRQSDG